MLLIREGCIKHTKAYKIHKYIPVFINLPSLYEEENKFLSNDNITIILYKGLSRVCQYYTIFLLYSWKLFLHITYIVLSQVISLFTRLTKEEKKVCLSKAKNKHLLHSFILTCHS